MSFMKEVFSGYQVLPKVHREEHDPAPEKRKEECDYKYINGVKIPDDDPHPMVIIIKEMTTAKAYEIGKVLAEHGITGTFQGGVLATQLANVWINNQYGHGPWSHPRRKKKADQ